MLKSLKDGFEKEKKQDQEKLDWRGEVKKRIQKQNEKLIKQINRQFKEHVAVIKEVEKGDNFDRETVLGSLKKSPLYGSQGEDGLVFSSWPSLENLKAKNNDVLKTLRLKKVEWIIAYDRIYRFRITLSDGSTKKSYPLHEEFIFPDDRPVRSVRIRHDAYFVYSLQFIDAANKVIKHIITTNKGEWSTLNLEEGEDIVGIQARENSSVMMAIGFLTIKK